MERNEIEAAFAQLLADETDEDKRMALLRRVRLQAMNQAPEEAFEPPIRTLRQYLEDPIEVPPELVEPFVVVRGGMTCTIGRAGKGKTVMNLNRLLRWSAGVPWLPTWKDAEGAIPLSPTKPLKTLIIENEGAGGLFHRQVGIMLHAEGQLSEEERELARENLLVWGDGGYAGMKLDDPAKLDSVRRGCEKWQPDVLFIEPFRGLWNGEENSATDMAGVVDALMEIGADFKCAILLAHHERKSGVGEDGEKMSAGRGSTVLEGAVTVMENFESILGGRQRELSWSKSRHAVAPNPARLEWVPDAWWYNHVPTTMIDEAVMAVLKESDDPLSVTELQEATDESKKTLRETTKRLKDTGRLRQHPAIQLPGGMGTTGPRYSLAGSDVTPDPGTGGAPL